MVRFSFAMVISSLLPWFPKEIREAVPPYSLQAPVPSALSSPNLYIEETVEGEKPFTSFDAGIENCKQAWTFTYPSFPYQGNKSVRFEIQNGQTPCGNKSKKIRSEVTIIRGSEYPGFSREAWYSFAVFFPSVGFEEDDTRDCINQWFEDGSDETTIRAQKDQAFLEVTPEAGSKTLYKYDLFGTSKTASTPTSFNKIPKDEWHEFVFHFIHSTGADGLIEVWRDGEKIHTIHGRNMHLKLPKWKVGLYKSSFLDQTSKRDKRVLYFDNIRVGNAKATLADMTSGKDSSSTGGTGNTQQVLSYTLVNASTEEDIMTIEPGAVISLSRIGTSKFNIRANLASETPGVLKMELSGSEEQTRFDDAAPYALFGDNRSGNYYSWNAEKGEYTLAATPYAGTKDKMGLASGPTYSISFRIVK